MTYEKKVGRFLKRRFANIVLSPWFAFTDDNGRGYAQPDALLICPDRVVIFEAKYTQRGSGYTQISLLYAPIIEHVYRKPFVGVQVCKVLQTSPGSSGIEFPEQALTEELGRLLTWHFLG